MDKFSVNSNASFEPISNLRYTNPVLGLVRHVLSVPASIGDYKVFTPIVERVVVGMIDFI